ncbi:hypothetical protein PLICBS_008026 [Purpureocillium lilacinum]|uniref:uncharacterized protein n=1 Tax=Purpureocillium lilacinum TaxID=33203 RepID=UPI00207DAA82|nr:hypothetical protein PLICBS_008026 [Purpureocillium lilacinum]
MLGFLTLASAGIGGNMAIQDYLAALRWTKDNIGAFGGDPKKTMLFGQSAGAVNAFAVASLPEVKDLVAAVVLQSGSGIDLTPNETAQYTGKSYAAALGCADHDVSDQSKQVYNRSGWHGVADLSQLKCLQSKPVSRLRAAYQKTAALKEKVIFKGHRSLGGTFGLNFPNQTNLNAAVLDGVVIKEEPLKVGSRVPVIVGSNGQDSSLFTHKAYKADNSSAEDAYARFLDAWGRVGPSIGNKYPLSAFNNSINAIVTRINTLAGFKCPAYKTLRATSAAGVPAYAYQFNHVPSCPWVWIRGKKFPPRRFVDEFGATHTAELPFVFGNLDNMPVGNGSCHSTAAERDISRGLVAAWTAMAADGDPSTHGRKWPRFDECDPHGMLVQDQSMAVAALDYEEL